MLRLRWMLTLFVVGATQGAKILSYFLVPGVSHHIAIQPILKELANRGHQIDFYSIIPMKDPHKNIREIPLKNVIEQNIKKMSFKDFGNLPTLLFTQTMFQMAMQLLDGIAKEPEFIKLINSNEKYDLVIGEFLFMNEDGTALVHKFNVPGVAIHPLGDCAWVNEISGLPDNPSYMIDFKSRFTDQMNFFQRVQSFFTTVTTNLVGYYNLMFSLQHKMDVVYNYTGWETRPRLPMLVSDLALILINSHHSVGYSYPKAPHVKEVAGVNIVPNKPLPQDLQTFMDSAKDGVIYFSFGSVVNVTEMMEDGAFDAFVNAFKALPQKVLWKWGKEVELPQVKASNIKFSHWFPQQDILAHKNTKVFITHGGLMSTIEAVNYGVPLIGMGVFGDQLKNIVRMKSAGYGVELRYANISEASISWAINEILTNPSYKKEILRRQALFKDRPMKPLEEAVYWIEYVLRHGKVLQPASARMPFYQVYLLDVLGLFFAILLFGCCLLKTALKFVFSKCFGKKSSPADKKKKKQ